MRLTWPRPVGRSTIKASRGPATSGQRVGGGRRGLGGSWRPISGPGWWRGRWLRRSPPRWTWLRHACRSRWGAGHAPAPVDAPAPVHPPSALLSCSLSASSPSLCATARGQDTRADRVGVLVMPLPLSTLFQHCCPVRCQALGPPFVLWLMPVLASVALQMSASLGGRGVGYHLKEIWR